MWVKVLDAVPKEGTMVATTLEGVKIFVIFFFYLSIRDLSVNI
jgi:hypothetical protein